MQTHTLGTCVFTEEFLDAYDACISLSELNCQS